MFPDGNDSLSSEGDADQPAINRREWAAAVAKVEVAKMVFVQCECDQSQFL